MSMTVTSLDAVLKVESCMTRIERGDVLMLGPYGYLFAFRKPDISALIGRQLLTGPT